MTFATPLESFTWADTFVSPFVKMGFGSIVMLPTFGPVVSGVLVSVDVSVGVVVVVGEIGSFVNVSVGVALRGADDGVAVGVKVPVACGVASVVVGEG